MAKGLQTVLTQGVSMSQASVMGAALVAGFVVWLLIEGKLGSYWSLLMGGAASGSSTAPATTTPPSTGLQPGPAAPGAAVNPGGGSTTLNPNPQYLIPPGYGLPGLTNPFYVPPAATPPATTGGH